MKMKKFESIVFTLALSSLLAACGNAETFPAASEIASKIAEPESSETKATVYKVALTGQTKPFNYYDENNELTGYEVDMLNTIDKKLDEVEFEYITTEFQSLFAGLDSGQFDLILNNITDKPERREKYLFSDNAYYYNHTVIATRPETTNITTLDDLQGVKIPVGAGTATDLFLQTYNEEHSDNPILMDYVEGDVSQAILSLYEGRYEAVLYSESYLDAVEKEYGYTFNRYTVEREEEIQNPAVYILFRKDDTELQKKIDDALTEIKEDGTLSELSVKYYGKDSTKALE